MIDFEITNVVTNKDAKVVKDGVQYDVHYILGNDEIVSVQCSVVRISEEQPEQLGYIRRETGRIVSDFGEGIAISGHLVVFEEIVGEIETLELK